MTEYLITPVAKPRQTRSDKWKRRDCVMRYRTYADEVRLLGVKIPESGARITFVMPMPPSWSKKKREAMAGVAHRQKPDVDNLCKALLDALYGDDSGVWDIHLRKVWGDRGMIQVEEVGS